MDKLACALVICAACGTDGGGHGSYDALRIDPDPATLTVALGSTATQPFQVFGVDGSDETDITELCQLAVDPAFGTFDAATFDACGMILA